MDEIKKMDGKSLDLTNENIEILKKLFPEVVTEGKIDFEKLRVILGDEIEKSDEKYEFTWYGKTNAVRLSQTPSMGTLRPDKGSSKNWDTAGNLYIEGDNLEVLKLLQKAYFGKIKMIYIDPPYNTGNDFVYKDDFRDNIKNYKEMTNQTTRANPETSGRYHTDWLNMMYPRLRLARNLLKDDGIIFISIDDNEVHNLRKICDEVFGEDNFVADLIWSNKEGGGSSDSKLFRIKHEHIICYSKNVNLAEIIGTPISNKDRYTLSDEFEETRGKYYLQKLGMGSIQYSESLDYPIETPDGNTITPKDNNNGKKACWRWSREKYLWGVNNGFIVIKKDSKGIWTVYTKQYMNCDNEGNIITRTQRPFGIIDEFSSTQASKYMDSIGLGTVFSYSKPFELIKYLIQRIDTKNNGIILDFFSGSATTAHAVMQLNAEDSGNRKFIMVQLPEPIDEKSEAYKAGYKNICDIGKERIRRAGEKIVQETGKTDLDIGFKVFKLDDSNIKTWDPDYSNENTVQYLLDMVNNIKEDRAKEDVLFEILLKLGFELTTAIEEIEVNKHKIYNVAKGALLVCLEDEISKDILDEIPKHKSEFVETRVVFRDNAFQSDADKLNAIQNLKQQGIIDVRSI